MIVVFTDSSYYNLRLKSTSCMYIHNIVANSQNDSVKLITFEFSSFNSFHAELIGVINVLRYTSEQNYNNDILVLYLDNSACLIILNDLNSGDKEKASDVVNSRQKNKYASENQTITRLLNKLAASNIRILLRHSKAHSISSTLLLSSAKSPYSGNKLIKDRLNELKQNISLYYNNILFKDSGELLLRDFYSACGDKSSREILYFTAYDNSKILFNHIVDRIAYQHNIDINKLIFLQ